MKTKSMRITAVLLTAALLTAGLVSCGKKEEKTTTTAPSGHEIATDEVAEQAWISHGLNFNGATGEEIPEDPAEVEARIIANAYMLYHVNGIDKAYDAKAYAAFFPMDYRDWHKEYYGPLEDDYKSMPATFTEIGEYSFEELEDPDTMYSEEIIEDYIEEISGETGRDISDPMYDLKRMMKKWTVKSAFRFTYTTKLTDGNKPCEARFQVINVGTGWYIDIRDEAGPKITEL